MSARGAFSRIILFPFNPITMIPKSKTCAFLPFLAALALPSCPGLASDTEIVPENNFSALKPHIKAVAKDTSAIRLWIEKNLDPSIDPTVMLSKPCREFSEDVSELAWGYDGSISETQLTKKWGSRFDTSTTWDHAFENGNCGWASRKLAGFEYLGELNAGDWFLLFIKGGCGENDFSESLQRVVKVERINGGYQITNLVNPEPM